MRQLLLNALRKTAHFFNYELVRYKTLKAEKPFKSRAVYESAPIEVYLK